MPSAQRLIVVTGANGYIGQHVLKQLLDDGIPARAVVRSQSSADRLVAVFRDHTHAALLSTTLVPDLLREENVYEDAFRDATAVIHLAAALPDAEVVQDAVQKFLDPAINGTLHAAKAAARQPSVQRFVLASSITAAFGSAVAPTTAFTTATYGSATYESASKEMLEPEVYNASKQLAEQAFWAYVKKEKPSYVATALLPSICVGPAVDPDAMPDASTNRWPLWWPRAADAFVAPTPHPAMVSLFCFTVVDIRNCARAFANAAVASVPNDKIDGERLYVSERTMDFYDGAAIALQAPAALTQHWTAEVRKQIEAELEKRQPAKQPVHIPQPFRDGAEALGIAPLTPATEAIRTTYNSEAKRIEGGGTFG